MPISPDRPARGQVAVPSPGRLAMLWLLVRFPRNPAAIYREVLARYGDTVWLYDLRGDGWLFLARPVDVRRIHRTNNRNYGRGSLNESFAAFLGSGLLTSEHDTWARHRRLLAPAFRGQAVARYIGAVRPHVHGLLDRWAQRCGGKPFNICPDLELFSYRAVAAAMFGLNSEGEAKMLGALDRALEYASRESFRLIGRPRWLGARAWRRFKRDLGILDSFVGPALAAVRAATGSVDGADGTAGEDNLLGRMVADQQLSDAEIRDEVLTMLHAGQHTVASGLSFALFLIASDERVQGELVEELRPLNRPLPSFEELSELPKLDAVIEESLRLYPPAWGGVREALADDELGDLKIMAGTPIVFSQFATHRAPSLWEAADEFCPFRADRGGGQDDFRYFPFGGGPHLCIGKEIALLEMKLVIAGVLARFRLTPAPGRRLRPQAMLDLIPRGGAYLALADRRGQPGRFES